MNALLKSRYSAKILKMGVPKNSYHIHIKVKMSNPSQVHPASSESPNQDFKDMDVLCPTKIINVMILPINNVTVSMWNYTP